MKKHTIIACIILLLLFYYIFFYSTPWSQAEKETAIKFCTDPARIHIIPVSPDLPPDVTVIQPTAPTIKDCTCFMDYVSKHISYDNFKSGTYIGMGFSLNLFDARAYEYAEDAQNACSAVIDPTW